ncbi:MAG: ornithine cyclodeaminase family protein [Rhizobiales bacterium]|nr:ornithine cyclodeaminase family protein [Hyphomicrobiales bacterium]
MKWIDSDGVARLAGYEALVEALREGFRAAIETPVRHHHDTGPATTLLLMPAWSKDWTGLKTVTVKTDNAALGLPTIQGSYLLIDNRTGAPVALMDGGELTRRRTAAASALAADYLARSDASVHAIFGAGALALHFARAHRAVRPLKTVHVVNRSRDKAEALVTALKADGFQARVSEAEEAVRAAHIVSCVTGSGEALVKGAWLQPGTHVDLAGAFRPTMRETDAEAVGRAVVYVDTHEGARAEAGDLIQAEREGTFSFDRVAGDLAALCRGSVKGRSDTAAITLFKSCGTALEDLAAAVMVHQRAG